MENPQELPENQNPSLIPSSNSHSSNSTSTTTSNGLQNPAPRTPTTAGPIIRSEPNNPYPTTFIQANITSFKQVVQMLTGSAQTAKQSSASKPDPPKNPIPPIKTKTGSKKEKTSKLYERRNSFKNFKVSPLVSGPVHSSGFSPRRPITPEIMSPSMLDFPGLVLSPVTPLIPDPFLRISANMDMEAEEKSIAKKGFYLHPSPANSPRDSESGPRLLPLFPVTSPRVSGSPSYS